MPPLAPPSLFKVVPEAKELISATKGDQGPHRQNQKLQMHANIVLKKVCNIAITLDDPVKVEEAQKALAILGSRHVGYGVKLKQAAVSNISCGADSLNGPDSDGGRVVNWFSHSFNLFCPETS
eukprot:TRINITY_DN10113_c0_g1_i2.p1 TRINITY_DN10113_c0_g1~~TRINITY_DN10113_c0_g1_i2.p1  ORF type:complete len:123 (+),score=10.74 TRINITY_DN10113_c0_g1_i2:86-454(+)